MPSLFPTTLVYFGDGLFLLRRAPTLFIPGSQASFLDDEFDIGT